MARKEIYHVSETGQTVSLNPDTFDLTPDTLGLLHFFRHFAKTDRLTATRILVEGWPMTPEQAEEILDGEAI
jgi:hypothetical protein